MIKICDNIKCAAKVKMTLKYIPFYRSGRFNSRLYVCNYGEGGNVLRQEVNYVFLFVHLFVKHGEGGIVSIQNMAFVGKQN